MPSTRKNRISYADIKRLIAEEVQFAITNSTDDHGSLNGLADDDHTQYALKTGATFTGPVYLNADPSVDLGAATKSYVDDHFDPATYRGLNHVPNQPLLDPDNDTSGVPQFWSQSDANITMTQVDISSESSRHRTGWQVVTNGSGAASYMYCRLTLSDCEYLFGGVAMSLRTRGYQASGGATISLKMVDSVGTIDTATTIADATMTDLKVENGSIDASATWVQLEIHPGAASKTIKVEPIMWNVGPKALPYHPSWLRRVQYYERMWDSNPAGTSNTTESSSAGGLTAAYDLKIYIDGDGTAARSVRVMPSYDSAMGASEAFRTNSYGSVGGNVNTVFIHCDDSQQVDWNVNNSGVTRVIGDIQHLYVWSFAKIQ